MGIICCICGKKQSGWIKDYPLAMFSSGYRVCAECNEYYEKIIPPQISPTNRYENLTRSAHKFHKFKPAPQIKK